MKKPLCKICDREGHYAYQCFKKQQKPLQSTKQMKRNGKHHRLWQETKARWYKANPFPHYTCYICGAVMSKEYTTLDHKIPRSRAPELRYDLNNLAPCCFACNGEKGSRVYDKDN